MKRSGTTIRSEPSVPSEVLDGPLLVKVLHCSEVEQCAASPSESFAVGDLVIVDSRYGPDLGRVIGPASRRNGRGKVEEKPPVRKATDEELTRYESNLRRERELFVQCRELIDRYVPHMKPVACHLVLGEQKLVLFFSSEGRVDFRELLKAMNSAFRMRVELRQIGPRDVARVVGGLGPCGRPLCCHSMYYCLPAVSIKMAKTQNLSLSSSQISGPCGRLLCCLAYEQGFYEEKRHSLPAEGTRVTLEEKIVRITEINPVGGRVTLRDEEGMDFTLPLCRLRYDGSRKQWEITQCNQDACPSEY